MNKKKILIISASVLSLIIMGLIITTLIHNKKSNLEKERLAVEEISKKVNSSTDLDELINMLGEPKSNTCANSSCPQYILEYGTLLTFKLSGAWNKFLLNKLEVIYSDNSQRNFVYREPNKNLTKEFIQENIKVGDTYESIVVKLGDPFMDACSGVHCPLYILNDGSTISIKFIGSKLNKVTIINSDGNNEVIIK